MQHKIKLIRVWLENTYKNASASWSYCQRRRFHFSSSYFEQNWIHNLNWNAAKTQPSLRSTQQQRDLLFSVSKTEFQLDSRREIDQGNLRQSAAADLLREQHFWLIVFDAQPCTGDDTQMKCSEWILYCSSKFLQRKIPEKNIFSFSENLLSQRLIWSRVWWSQTVLNVISFNSKMKMYY